MPMLLCFSALGAALITVGWIVSITYLDYCVASHRPMHKRGQVPFHQQLALEKSLGLPWEATHLVVTSLAVFGLALAAVFFWQVVGWFLVGGTGAIVLLVMAFFDWPHLQQRDVDWPRFVRPNPLPLAPVKPGLSFPEAPGTTPSRAWLECTKGEHTGKRFSLSTAKFTIGRSASNTLRLRHKRVSREHAHIRYQAKHFYIQHNLSSKGETFRNGKRVEAHVLKDGDCITIADNVFIFHNRSH